MLGGSRRVLLEGDRLVANLASGGRGDLLDGLPEGQKTRAGQLVELAYVTVVGERRDRDVGDVLRVNKRLGRIARGEGHHPGEHVLEHVVLAEVLGKPGRAQDRELSRRVAHRLLGFLCLRLAASGQEHEARDRLLDG